MADRGQGEDPAVVGRPWRGNGGSAGRQRSGGRRRRPGPAGRTASPDATGDGPPGRTHARKPAGRAENVPADVHAA
ncbi:hypothetical protein GCM10010405_43590 [Streptomyces macrosporus]|uniref:Uncharacterized protein n=1 Tax=Streptomyces macrosporus TaxID=44032 RepID=A0ABP5XFY2_9ACTN